MTDFQKHSPVLRQMDRRTLLGSAAAGMLAKGLGGRGAMAAIGGEDEIAHWTPDYVTGIAGTDRGRYGSGMRKGCAAEDERQAHLLVRRADPCFAAA